MVNCVSLCENWLLWIQTVTTAESNFKNFECFNFESFESCYEWCTLAIDLLPRTTNVGLGYGPRKRILLLTKHPHPARLCRPVYDLKTREKLSRWGLGLSVIQHHEWKAGTKVSIIQETHAHAVSLLQSLSRRKKSLPDIWQRAATRETDIEPVNHVDSLREERQVLWDYRLKGALGIYLTLQMTCAHKSKSSCPDTCIVGWEAQVQIQDLGQKPQTRKPTPVGPEYTSIFSQSVSGLGVQSP